MTVEYKGYQIEVKRERASGGWMQLYYSIIRGQDGYECLNSYEESKESVRGMIKYLKNRIDNEHETNDPWGESQDLD
jgi:hypothetical protein